MNTLELTEAISEKVHDNWVAMKRLAGTHSRKLDTTGEELLVPYADLTEAAKELDRGTVRTTLSALRELGYVVAPALPNGNEPKEEGT